MTRIEQYLSAARVPVSLKSQQFGDWDIRRHETDHGICTFLSHSVTHKVDMSNLHLCNGQDTISGWHTVMEDSPKELRQHLPIWLSARGRILITGLGLGCVVRGLLHSPFVEHIDVIEIDPDIHAIIGEEFCGNPRVTLHLADALKYKPAAGSRWDYAWHDLWTPDNTGLQILHAKLFRRYLSRVKHLQGAWAFPRSMKRLYAAKMGGILA